MEFRVLGSVEVIGDGGPLRVASGRQMALLALLLIHANRPLSADRIIDELWADEPPESGAKTVAFHVSKLRDALAPGRARDGSVDPGAGVVTELGGYVLRVPQGSLDSAELERLASEGRASLHDDPVAARSCLAAALELWRGEPYRQVADEPFALPEIARLEELRLRTEEDLADADLMLGRHADAVARLEALVAANPLRERPRGQLMLALYRSGRQADALRTFAQGRSAMAADLGIDPGPELRQLETWILRQDPRLDLPRPRGTSRNPYKGLRAFHEADSGDFFGREVLVARLVDRLAEVAREGRLLVVIGPSGCGKSSAVGAGLLSALRTDAIPGSSGWRIASMVPGARPFRELVAALRRAWPEASPDALAGIVTSGDLTGAMTAVAGEARQTTLLVIDQFEELSTVADNATAERFVASLVEALAEPDTGLVVVATLRADHLAGPLRRSGLGELVRAGAEIVTPLTREELERAVVLPATRVGVTLEPGLAPAIVADAGQQPGELPLLQFALTELFSTGDGVQLTRAGYAAVGGVTGAMARTAEAAFAGLDAEDRELARQVFLRLVAIGETGIVSGRRVARADLRALAADATRVDAVVDALGARRLLSFDRDAVTGDATVEVAHDALPAGWKRLAGWIEAARDDLRIRRRLAEATGEWLGAGRDPGYLLSGSRLDLFVAWASSTDLRLDTAETAMLDASRAEQRQREDTEAARATHERVLERRAARRLRLLVAVLAAAVIVASTLSVALYAQRQDAVEQAQIAQARERAAASIGILGTDPRLSLLLAWYAAEATAGRGYVTEEALDALDWSIQASHVAYPGDAAAYAVRDGPSGPRGAPLLAPEALMQLAARQHGRSLTPAECATYLHASACPSPPTEAVGTGLVVRTAAGLVATDHWAATSLAGTRVTVASELPVDLEAFRAGFGAETGIAVDWQTAGEGTLAARTTDDLPDVAILARPADVASLARGGQLADLSGIVDAARLRDQAGRYLLGLDSIGPDGVWPDAGSTLYGATLATEAESLVWYPRDDFAAAGHRVPTTWDELTQLTSAMLAKGQAPWCIGLNEGPAGATSLVGLVEDGVLGMDGPTTYDRWAGGQISFSEPSLGSSFDHLASILFTPGSVAGGLEVARSIPPDVAAGQMSRDPTGCWLYPAGGTGRLTWNKVLDERLAAFPMPPTYARNAGVLRGRAWTVVVFHDRPEVRQLVRSLMVPTAWTVTALAGAGLWQVGASMDALPEASSLATAQRADLFRVSATDLLVPAAANAFRQGLAEYAAKGAFSYPTIIGKIEHVWGKP